MCARHANALRPSKSAFCFGQGVVAIELDIVIMSSSITKFVGSLPIVLGVISLLSSIASTPPTECCLYADSQPIQLVFGSLVYCGAGCSRPQGNRDARHTPFPTPAAFVRTMLSSTCVFACSISTAFPHMQCIPVDPVWTVFTMLHPNTLPHTSKHVFRCAS